MKKVHHDDITKTNNRCVQCKGVWNQTHTCQWAIQMLKKKCRMWWHNAEHNSMRLTCPRSGKVHTHNKRKSAHNNKHTTICEISSPSHSWLYTTQYSGSTICRTKRDTSYIKPQDYCDRHHNKLRQTLQHTIWNLCTSAWTAQQLHGIMYKWRNSPQAKWKLTRQLLFP